MSANRPELQSLLKACRLLMRSILTATDHGQDPRAWPLRIRNAENYVRKAVVSLNLDSNAIQVHADSLDRIAATLTTRLVQDLMVEVDREQDGDVSQRMDTSLYDREGFHGYTWSISLPDLMGFLQMHQKNGILRVNIGTELVSLVFDEGDLVHAASDNSPPGARLGEILVRQGAIDMAELERFLVAYSAFPGRLGNALESQGLITRVGLQKALDSQVEQIFSRLFSTDSAYYSFREGHSEEKIDVRWNVLQLLLETCRVHDEAQKAPQESAGDSGLVLP